ncbi:hypothetical protein D3C86_1766200 [compost metagenome]
MLRRCSPTLRLTASKRLPAGALTRSHLGLGSNTWGSLEARRFCPSLIAVVPWVVRNFSPLATGLAGEVSDIGNLGSAGGSVDEAACGRRAVYHRSRSLPVERRAAQAGGRGGWLLRIYAVGLASSD